MYSVAFVLDGAMEHIGVALLDVPDASFVLEAILQLNIDAMWHNVKHPREVPADIQFLDAPTVESLTLPTLLDVIRGGRLRPKLRQNGL